MMMISSKQVALVVSGLLSATEMQRAAAQTPSPTTSPTSMPSSIPSQQPSSIPSTAPSGQPSSIPSEAPSSIPSEAPSGQPSSIPSLQPSSIPSTAPSGQPSSIPSEMPSCTPSAQPSSSPFGEVFLFYPDWSAGSVGCKNDGKEPSYMYADPSNYMSSTLDACCTTYFGWNYDICMGLLPGICARALFYPDWEGSNKECVDDGNEPSYMTANPVGYMFTHKTDCCEHHYNWNYDECVGLSTNANSNLYYPDWEKDHTCKKGGDQPQYMNKEPDTWMYATIDECCSSNFQYKLDECLGTSGAAVSTAPGSAVWYPDWVGTEHVCKNDGKQPAYMRTNPEQWMHTTQLACCDKNYNWNSVSCLAYGSSSSSTPAGSSKFYMNWVTSKCVQDCVGSAPCGGLADFWDDLYDTRASCCSDKGYWNKDCATD